MVSGAEVVALVRSENPKAELFRSGLFHQTTLVHGDVQDHLVLARTLIEHNIEVVFHLAAQSIVRFANSFPLETFETNVRGTYMLLEACRAQGRDAPVVVVSSSDKAYGFSHPLPYTENMALQGSYPYEVSKSCADLIAQSYAQTYGLRVGITRCGNIYGGGDLNWTRLIPGAIYAFLKEEPPILHGDGSATRDYIYVKDVVQGYLLLAQALYHGLAQGEAFNFSYGKPLTCAEVVSIIQKNMGATIEPIRIGTYKGEILHQYLCPAKAQRILKWIPQYDFEGGLRETIPWYVERANNNV